MFHEGSGHSNPYNHLEACIGQGKTIEEQSILL